MKRRAPSAGTAVVELAMCLPVLVALFLGTLQFGYMFYLYNELEQAVRAGARYASLRTYASATSTPDSAYLTAVRNVVVYASPAGGTQAIVPGLATSQVSVNVTFHNQVPVSVGVAITNYPLSGIIRSITLTNKPATEFPYLGVFAPPAS
jgi:Flp pilus assembly protein TadG